MNAPHWPEEQQAILREYWPTSLPIRLWMHLLPGKSRDAIISKGRRMQLGERVVNRKPTYTQSWICIEQLLADGARRSVPEIAKRTGLTHPWCASSCRIGFACKSMWRNGVGKRTSG